MFTYKREIKTEKTIIAICYDFDKTLSPTDMQAQGYIQSIDYDVKVFWEESNTLAERNDMDQNLAYMYKMVQEPIGKFYPTREKLENYGSSVELFPGVETWFDRINEYADTLGLQVEHYVISSGLKEMIEGTTIARKGVFKKIYASSFFYNEKGIAVWPAQVVNFTGKTQYIFRISKGVLDVNDAGVNEHFDIDKLRIPFRNIIYIGDSDTDIPCMKLVTTNGGHSIGVYDVNRKDKTKVQKMIRDERISYYAAADYSDGEELDLIVKAIIDRTAQNERLEKMKSFYIDETNQAYDGMTEEQQKRGSLIIDLENSKSFTSTHTIIGKMKDCRWDKNERERLYSIACTNTQVNWIITDDDVKAFYTKLLTEEFDFSETAEKVKKLLVE